MTGGYDAVAAQAPPQSRPIVSQSDSLGAEDSVGEKSREDPSDPGGEPRRARLEFRIGRAAAAHLRRRAAADGDQRHRPLAGAGAGRPARPPGPDPSRAPPPSPPQPALRP